jgi:cytohesin
MGCAVSIEDAYRRRLQSVCAEGRVEELRTLRTDMLWPQRVKDESLTDTKGITLLMRCLQTLDERHLTCARMLLEAGASPNTQDMFGTSPLMLAVSHGSVEAAAALIAHGASVNFATSTGWRAGRTALMVATGRRHLDCVRLLLDHGADVNASDMRGVTAVHFACDWPEGLRLLLDRGADAGKLDRLGYSAILRATYIEQNIACVEMLAATGKGVAAGDQLVPPLFAACCSSSSDAEGAASAVEVLLRHGANPNLRLSRMFVSASTSQRPLYAGATPLHVAAMRGSRRNMRALLAAGADPNSRDQRGVTPLLLVACHVPGAPGRECAALLLRAGADPVNLVEEQRYIFCQPALATRGAVHAIIVGCGQEQGVLASHFARRPQFDPLLLRFLSRFVEGIESLRIEGA